MGRYQVNKNRDYRPFIFKRTFMQISTYVLLHDKMFNVCTRYQYGLYHTTCTRVESRGIHIFLH